MYVLYLFKERDEKLRSNRIIGHVVEQASNQGTYSMYI